uniref:Uncharacterized protein n=1 Tax=Anguilla anguilla TaxID=7936 RepID=A0A0E9TCE5_ANGAN
MSPGGRLSMQCYYSRSHTYPPTHEQT